MKTQILAIATLAAVSLGSVPALAADTEIANVVRLCDNTPAVQLTGSLLHDCKMVKLVHLCDDTPVAQLTRNQLDDCKTLDYARSFARTAEREAAAKRERDGRSR